MYIHLIVPVRKKYQLATKYEMGQWRQSTECHPAASCSEAESILYKGPISRIALMYGKITTRFNTFYIHMCAHIYSHVDDRFVMFE